MSSPITKLDFTDAKVLTVDTNTHLFLARSTSTSQDLSPEPQVSSHTSPMGTSPRFPPSQSAASDSTPSTQDDTQRPVFRENHCIFLPHQTDPVNHFALDIGGSLIKMVYFESDNVGPPTSQSSDEVLVQDVKLGGGRLCFVKFLTSEIEDCIEFVSALITRTGGKQSICATGGGAHKFSELFRTRLGITLSKKDEMKCLISGLNFLLSEMPNESFTYEGPDKKCFVYAEQPYPYLLVQVGSGVSMLKVDGPTQFERVSGSSLGGGTFWGLCRLLTGQTDFDEIVKLCESGDNRRVDMLVGDIYGTDYSKVGLRADTIASSVGKVTQVQGDEQTVRESFRPQDIAKSLMFMISNNIGQIAYLNAQRLGLERVYFGGFFIRDHPYTMECISYGINYWSHGRMKALFLKHEGFLGALGAFLENTVTE